MGWLDALSSPPQGLVAAGRDTRRDQTASLIRPSETRHSAHEIRQLKPSATCARCHRAPVSRSRKWPMYCEGCVQLMEDIEGDARRELDDERAERSER